mgnify:CR=1 FL=1
MSLEPVLTPGGHLLVERSEETGSPLSLSAVQRLQTVFDLSGSHGLEFLASAALQESLTPAFSFWREFARRYFAALCHHPGIPSNKDPGVPPPDVPSLTALVEGAPPMRGLEYLDPGVLTALWRSLDSQVCDAIQRTDGGLKAYLHALNPIWNTVGRVTFHLAENKRNPEQPFAFLATYAQRLSAEGRVQHTPLGRALEEYAGSKNRAALIALLSPVQRAAETSSVARELLESRALFHPQAWTPAQAYRFLKEIPQLEQSGIIVRIPDWWKAGNPPRPQIRVRIGENSAMLLGRDSLLDFNLEKTLDGEPLTEAEWTSLLNSANGLVLLKGRWVEVDTRQLQEVLAHWKKVEAGTGPEGMTFLQGLRLLSGFDAKAKGESVGGEMPADWSSVVAGEGLRRTLTEMQDPRITFESDPGAELHAELRPYQRQGLHWLWFMTRLQLGACLADDMGLGKTIQVIALLLVLKRRPLALTGSRPSLLIVPASLIANWKAELRRFAPSLKAFFLHPSETPADQLAEASRHPDRFIADRDLVITSYSLLMRTAWLKPTEWNLVILDEAQAIKNPGARQTRAVKELKSRSRIALSGTPIENRLADLWSLFDFLCPGLLGNSTDFGSFVKNRTQVVSGQFAPLRRLVRPYILRRLKTDRRIITDLPEKTELDAFCTLTRRQAVLYEQAVRELAEHLESSSAKGIQRRGVILAFLTRFKQICNHPSQWLADGAYSDADSGKFQRLRELCEEIAARQEKVLVFSQYREISEPLARHLAGVFGRPGLVLHGGTAISQRRERVQAFQQEGGAPFFVLSLKAGGTGLNLTAASHVIHFDRWWNPAVENQATDRAFRIGQKRNVMVHKFICRGTLEERIHELITNKKALAEDVLGEGGERLLTEMNNSELLQFVALDIKAIAED